ncbi:MAG: WecB/TagA/CpsF family glycosyltransferase [Candidatus Berkelbacteria bacterium]|nr:WecB/TagA/CpsF family glycosyltransferase [Candidatus Berkelbacteria bacterium]
MSIERKKILGVPIDKIDFRQTVIKIEKLIKSDTSHQVATVNPEFVMAAQKNREFKRVLNSTSLNTPEAAGVFWAMRFLHGIKLKEKVPGVDLFWALCKLSEDRGYRIFMLGGKPGVAKKAAGRVKLIHPRARIVYTYPGSPKETKKIRRLINHTQPNILFVAWGSPKQDIWINKNLRKFQTSLVAVGVGGTFDFIAGVRIRAPKWMQKIGLEWLYRLFQEPKRFGRIWTAVVRFPLAVFFSKFKRKAKDEE